MGRRSKVNWEKKFFDRLTSKFLVGDECWLWLPPLVKKYGVIQVGGKSRKAHRVVYEYLVGPIPDGMTIDHMCLNKHCVRPAHMTVKSGPANSSRYWQEERTQCKRGHEWPKYRNEWGGNGYCIVCKQERDRERWRRQHGWYNEPATPLRERRLQT